MPQATDSSTTFHAELAYSVFQNYLQALSKEHTVVDSILVQAKDVLMQHASQKQGKEPTTSSSFSCGEENAQNREDLEQVEISIDVTDSFQDGIVQLHIQDKEEVDIITECQDISSAIKAVDGGVDDIGATREDSCRQFKDDYTSREEGEEVKSAVEKYQLEQVQLEEQLSRELNQREVFKMIL